MVRPSKYINYNAINFIFLSSTFSYLIGPVSPVVATSTRYINGSHSTATIEWRVSAISYTPENYTVEYGTSSSSLTERSTTLSSSSDLTVTNMLYSVTITGLSSNTTYYYRVVSSNGFFSTATSQRSFVSVALCMLLK